LVTWRLSSKVRASTILETRFLRETWFLENHV